MEVRELLAEAAKRRDERDERARVAARKGTLIGTALRSLRNAEHSLARKENRADKRAEDEGG